nr:MAG: hypothetical protein [Microviridae sp.]
MKDIRLFLMKDEIKLFEDFLKNNPCREEVYIATALVEYLRSRAGGRRG